MRRILLPWWTHTLEPEAIGPEALAAMRHAVLSSPLMAANNLNQRFAGTYGFSVAFTRAGLARVHSAFPAFAPFLDRVLRDDCQAFFLNPLLVADGGAVAPHRDKSLHSYHEEVAFPRVVSVLYLSVPERLEGGEFELYRDQRLIARLPPRTGTLLTFRGAMRHAVAAVSSGAAQLETARLSLVIEQYRVPDRLLASLPTYRIGTRREAPQAALAEAPGEGTFGDAVRAYLDDPPSGLPG